jgi:dihydroflavonol-4-reductase
MLNPYKRSKWQAEQVALEMARKGLPVVIVNPSAPIGPGDIKPTPTGQVIVDFLRGQMPAYLDTGLNWVDVRDVAAGHFLAGESGKPGQRYILGNLEGNWTMKQFLDALSEITGKPAPRMKVPYAVAWTAAAINEGLSRITGNPPTAPMGGVRMARHLMWFDPGRAVRELGMPQTPVTTAITDAVNWFRSHLEIPD